MMTMMTITMMIVTEQESHKHYLLENSCTYVLDQQLIILSANLLTMHSLSQLGSLKPPAQSHMQAPSSRAPPFRQARVQANREQRIKD